MDDDAEDMSFEVEAIVAEAVAGEGAAVAGQGAEVGVLALEFLREAAELAEDVQLEVPGELAEFSGTGRIEDDLERLHPWAGFRVGEVEARRELKKERGDGLISRLPPLEDRNGVTTSSSPREVGWEENEDVAVHHGTQGPCQDAPGDGFVTAL